MVMRAESGGSRIAMTLLGVPRSIPTHLRILWGELGEGYGMGWAALGGAEPTSRGTREAVGSVPTYQVFRGGRGIRCGLTQDRISRNPTGPRVPFRPQGVSTASPSFPAYQGVGRVTGIGEYLSSLAGDATLWLGGHPTTVSRK